MSTIRITTVSNYYNVDTQGRISYTHKDGSVFRASDNWRVTGAVEYRNVFGREVVSKYYSLQEVMEGKVPFRYKNGKQRCHLTDYDHGSYRIWNHNHDVVFIG